jgi:hypothetical protein
MTSFLRISDIPADELHLLPILGLRQQIREDRCRFSPPAAAAQEPEAGAGKGRAHQAGAPPAGVSLAERERFITDWQLHDEPRPGSRFRFGSADPRVEAHTTDGAIDALYVELGGEG